MGWRFGVDEVLLHFASGGEGDEHVSGRADCREGVRDAARSEDGLACAQVHALIADLEGDFALHDVEPLLLGEMHMAGPGLWRAVRLLCSMMKRLPAESAVATLKARELKPRSEDGLKRSWPAATGWSSARRGRRGSLRHQIVQRHGGSNGRGSLEEGAAWQSHGLDDKVRQSGG